MKFHHLPVVKFVNFYSFFLRSFFNTRIFLDIDLRYDTTISKEFKSTIDRAGIGDRLILNRLAST